MKKLLVAFTLLTSLATLAHGQGTIAFGNSALTRVINCTYDRFATAADGLIFGVFYGPANTSADRLIAAPAQAGIGNTPGVLVNAPSVFALPNTEPGQVVSLQIRAWDSAGGYVNATDVRQVTLAPTAGPGTVIWQTASGTSPNRFYPMRVGALGDLYMCIPEPSTLAFMALGSLLLLFFRRKSVHK